MKARAFSVGSVCLLAACGGDDAASTLSVVPSTSVTTTTSTLAAVGEVSVDEEESTSEVQPWLAIPTALETLEEGKVAEAIEDALATRLLHRDVEQSRIELARVGVYASLTDACDGNAVSKAFREFQTAEADSLAADRATLTEILTLAGADGRTRLWDVIEPGEVLPAARHRMMDGLLENLPGWFTTDADPDRDLELRRVRLGQSVWSTAHTPLVIY